MKEKLMIFLLIPFALSLWAGWQEEAAAGAGRGKYLAAQGLIIPRNEVRVNSYIASIDYNYPFPEEDLGVNLYAGHRQIAASGQEEIVQIGIQAHKVPFSELPPMNLAFVIDHSGSMAAQDKLDWVKQAFEVFIQLDKGEFPFSERLREIRF